MTYLRILLFFLSFLGINLFVQKIITINKKISLPISIVFITLVLYIFSLISLLKIAFILLFIIGILFLLFFIIKKEINYKSLISFDSIIFYIIILYIVLISKNLHFTNIDNYSHWALIVKLILESGNLPKSLDVLSFVYPPGTALFISFFSYICGNYQDGMFIVAQNIISICFLKGIYNLIDTKQIIYKRIIFLLIFLFMGAYLIAFNDLLVDSILVLVLVFLILLIKNSNKKDNIFFTVLISLPYLYLIKNIGLFLAVCIIMYYYLKNKNKKQLVFLIIALLLTYGSWSLFVNLNYTNYLSEANHSLSINYFVKIIKNKGVGNSIRYYLNYTLEFFNYKKYYTNLIFLILNIILFLFTVLKKFSFKKLLALDYIYILYFYGLGLVYVFSMPIGEALSYACYDRYMMIPLLIIIFLLVYDVIKVGDKKQCAGLLVLLLIGVLFRVNELDPMIGIDNFEYTDLYICDNIYNSVDLSNKIIGLYSEDYNYDVVFDTGILYYTIYKLNSKNCGVIYDLDFYDSQKTITKDGAEVSLSYPEVLIVFDHLENIQNKLDEIGYQQINDNVFILNE